MEVEGVVAYSPSHGALFTGRRGLVGLALDTKIHNVVSADGAVVDNNIPSPQRNSIPLFDLKALLSIGGFSL